MPLCVCYSSSFFFVLGLIRRVRGDENTMNKFLSIVPMNTERKIFQHFLKGNIETLLFFFSIWDGKGKVTSKGSFSYTESCKRRNIERNSIWLKKFSSFTSKGKTFVFYFMKNKFHGKSKWGKSEIVCRAIPLLFQLRKCLTSDGSAAIWKELTNEFPSQEKSCLLRQNAEHFLRFSNFPTEHISNDFDSERKKIKWSGNYKA